MKFVNKGALQVKPLASCRAADWANDGLLEWIGCATSSFWCKVSAVSKLVPAIGHLGDGGARGARYFGALSNPVSTLTVLMPISATA